VHLVTVLEEMPVQETIDGIEQLREEGLPVGGVIVNMVRPQDLDTKALSAARKGKIDPASLAADLKTAGVEVDDNLVDGLLAEARDHAERRDLEDSQRELVRTLDVPSYELPRMPGGVDLGALYEIAAELKKQGMA
jgi:anion-transporting  ArsA/GET3 family ATPase